MKAFSRFLLLRTLSIIPTIFGVLVVTFILSHVVPGNPAIIVIGPSNLENKTQLLQMEKEMGLNQPLLTQFYDYIYQLLRGNLGFSYIQQKYVSYLIGQYLPASMELAITALVIGLPLAISIGIYAALRVNKPADHASRVGSLLGVSMPVFWVGYIMIFIFYTVLRIAPAPLGQLGVLNNNPPRITGMIILDSLLSGQFGNFASGISHILLPAIVLSFAVIAVLSRVTRSSMLEVLSKDYMRTVFAIGLPRRVMVNKYALRNALLPAITVAAIQMGALMGGVVLTETVFSWQGLGLYAFNSISNKDYPSIMGVVLVSAALFALANLVADLLYAYIDPRVTFK